MFISKMPKRKIAGFLVIAVSVLLLITTTFSPYPRLSFVNMNKDILRIGSYASIAVGAYLLAGPLGAAVTILPLVAAGCFGGGGGGGKPEPDLPEPPGPPED